MEYKDQEISILVIILTNGILYIFWIFQIGLHGQHPINIYWIINNYHNSINYMASIFSFMRINNREFISNSIITKSFNDRELTLHHAYILSTFIKDFHRLRIGFRTSCFTINCWKHSGWYIQLRRSLWHIHLLIRKELGMFFFIKEIIIIYLDLRYTSSNRYKGKETYNVYLG